MDNHANEGGGAIFFVSNDRTGTMSIRDSTLDGNPNDGFHTAGLPGIYFLGVSRPMIAHSSIQSRGRRCQLSLTTALVGLTVARCARARPRAQRPTRALSTPPWDVRRRT